MTARWAHLPYEFLEHVSNRIVNEIEDVSRFLDQSQDELMIHLIASSFPILIGWILRVLLVGRKHFLQCFWVFSKML